MLQLIFRFCFFERKRSTNRGTVTFLSFLSVLSLAVQPFTVPNHLHESCLDSKVRCTIEKSHDVL